MLPWIGVAAVGASLLTAATIKIVEYFKEKRAQDQQTIDTAKQEIIKALKHTTKSRNITIRQNKEIEVDTFEIVK